MYRDRPGPHPLGVFERITVGSDLMWMAVVAVALIRPDEAASTARPRA